MVLTQETCPVLPGLMPTTVAPTILSEILHGLGEATQILPNIPAGARAQLDTGPDLMPMAHIIVRAEKVIVYRLYIVLYDNLFYKKI